PPSHIRQRPDCWLHAEGRKQHRPTPVAGQNLMNVQHVVLVTYGEPPSPGFLSQLVYSWRILLGLTRTVADIPAAVLPLIALSRARARWKLWTQEQYSSPLEPISQRQATRLQEALQTKRSDIDWRMHVAYEFRQPLLANLLASLPPNEPVVIVPMYAAD